MYQYTAFINGSVRFPIKVFKMLFVSLLQPFWKKSGESNYINGKIKMGKETLCRIEGKWVGLSSSLDFCSVFFKILSVVLY